MTDGAGLCGVVTGDRVGDVDIDDRWRLGEGQVLRSGPDEFLLRGGLLGLGHIRKGTVEMGDPVFEYEYIDAYLHYSAFALLKLDLWILYKGLTVVVKGKGL